ncbi:MAG: hypothetical protein K2X09_04895 [Rickettsiales bacterium]|nr:hypothetical protein [Rickettsiales bacterium]
MQPDSIEIDLKVALAKAIFGKPRKFAESADGTLDHPIIKAIQRRELSAGQMLQFCDTRYNAASKFELLLERAKNLAEAQGKTQLAEALS